MKSHEFIIEKIKRLEEGKDNKIAQLKKDHDTAVHWSKNETSPQKREAARQKAEKIKRHLDTQYRQGVAEVSDATLTSYLTKLDKDNLKHRMDPTKRSDTKRMKSGPNFVKAFTKLDNRKQGVAEGSDSNLSYQGNCTEDDVIEHIFGDVNNFANMVEEHGDEFTVGDLVVKYDPETDVHSFYYKKQGVAEGVPARGEIKPNPHLSTPDKKHSVIVTVSKDGNKERRRFNATHNLGKEETSRRALAHYTNKGYKVHDFDHEQGVAEGEEHLDRIRKLSGLGEATKLPASTRDLKGQEFQDYMNRIKGTDDIDKKTGQVKLDKKGNEKYVSGKTKSDKYKMPYIHRSSIIEYLGPDGKTYDEDKIKQALSQRPKSLLKQNEKMKHSNGEFEQFFNVGFAALTGIAVDEQTNNLIIVNTCPGAGSCKVDCFAMKGGKVQFKAAWQSDGRILTYLLNDPDGFFNQLSAEISKEEQLGQKGDKKFPNGWKTTIRWHDAGDFFSPEYLDMALKMAAKHPDTKFYAYTKMAGAALAQKPPNFIINWSEGANTSQEKQVKAKDANLDTTKNSRIVPDDLFQDLLVKDEKKNLVKGASGQWQVQPDKLPELKQRLASEYGLSANSILSYDEYMAKRKSIPAGMKYNVIVAPGEGDISANDQNIISTLLLRH
jgi:hypothetical protein